MSQQLPCLPRPLAGRQGNKIFMIMTARKTGKYLYERDGLTLVELLVATVVFSMAFIGLLMSFVRSMELHETSRNTSCAIAAVRSRLEVIKNTDFADIEATYHNVTFTDSSISGIGVSYVDASNPDLLEITICFSWKQKNGRIIGEDSDLDGVLDSGEDTNSDGRLSSPAEVITYIYNVG